MSSEKKSKFKKTVAVQSQSQKTDNECKQEGPVPLPCSLSERILFQTYPEYVNSVFVYAKEMYLGKDFSADMLKEFSESIKRVGEFLQLIGEKVKTIKTM